jgi:hypothetical protein
MVMRLTGGGPGVPDPRLQAHEHGPVACSRGAGVSCPAGLPGFRGLLYPLLRCGQVGLRHEAR